MRALRRALSIADQHHAASKLSFRLQRHPLFIHAKRIAFYIPNDGEISPEPLLSLAIKHRKQCYLPAILEDSRLEFRRVGLRLNMVVNRFGIPEPHRSSGTIRAQDLDVVFTPLVAFDPQGNRLGMGGGFYDRSFAFKRAAVHTQPKLVGLAHSFQQVEEIAREGWDIGMSHIATDKHIWRLPLPSAKNRKMEYEKTK